MHRRFRFSVFAFALSVFAPAVASGQEAKAVKPEKAEVTLRDLQGEKVGEAKLIQAPSGVLIRVELDGVPEGTHAFHVHETGVCEPPFKSAGGHLATAGQAHGLLDADTPHVGDLPNIHVPDDGELRFSAFLNGASLSGPGVVLLDDDGSAIVIHTGPDDYLTDPAGDAGERIACGPISP